MRAKTIFVLITLLIAAVLLAGGTAIIIQQNKRNTFKGLKLYRDVVDKNMPWPSLISVYRLPYISWPPGVTEPVVKPDPEEDVLKRVPVVAVAIILKGSTEYRSEVTSKSTEGNVELHTFLLPDAETASKARREWENVSGLTTPPAEMQHWFFDQNVNAVTLGYGTNGEFLNAIRVMVYKQR